MPSVDGKALADYVGIILHECSSGRQQRLDTLNLARPAGLEPAAPSLEGWCSIQLSYGRVPLWYADRRTLMHVPAEIAEFSASPPKSVFTVDRPDR